MKKAAWDPDPVDMEECMVIMTGTDRYQWIPTRRVGKRRPTRKTEYSGLTEQGASFCLLSAIVTLFFGSRATCRQNAKLQFRCRKSLYGLSSCSLAKQDNSWTSIGYYDSVGGLSSMAASLFFITARTLVVFPALKMAYKGPVHFNSYPRVCKLRILRGPLILKTRAQQAWVLSPCSPGCNTSTLLLSCLTIPQYITGAQRHLLSDAF